MLQLPWRPRIEPWESYIVWKVDGAVVHADTGVARKTIPWEPTLMVVGLLKPHTSAASGTSYLDIDYVSYAPLSTGR